MKKTKLLFSALIATFLFAACSSEEGKNGTNDGRTAKKGDQDQLAQLQNEALAKLRENFTFNANQEKVTITTKKGIRINIDPRRLRRNGQPVNGPVQVEFIGITSRSEMIRANKTTIGLLGTGSGGSGASSASANAAPPSDADQQFKALETGGEIFINMKQEGQNLDNGSQFQLAIPVQLTGGADDEMIAWKGQPAPDGDVRWEKELEPDGSDKDVPVSGVDYIMNLQNFGWCNVDKFAQYGTMGSTPLSIQVPSGYDDTNAKVYIAYSGVVNSIAKMDAYNWTTNLFEEHGGFGVIGVPLRIIFVSGAGGSWVYADVPVTLTPGNPPVVVPASALNTTTDAGFITYLNSLP